MHLDTGIAFLLAMQRGNASTPYWISAAPRSSGTPILYLSDTVGGFVATHHPWSSKARLEAKTTSERALLSRMAFHENPAAATVEWCVLLLMVGQPFLLQDGPTDYIFEGSLTKHPSTQQAVPLHADRG
jgi:hypothetical protein